mmetsp:Transcript_111937/g.176305  ORF Transcript_111937/g.176305 Transcript_111937/m.176305 type:complete len:151 (-) Transcript_111937:99-551(-)|eukprot:CAMPEP_0169111054 /NCGR_PEP_ID=MMETSP1015-20121227/26858_1 /TAXON_ID=342587 /ORGANISM="Karlodinium micrum, Strain CCMP2283" /LENGTH=150 /DNA_ID=CAMNT_0009172921 /DNA_START=76 /DNA_END=528 /DNA_ORIENTATION=+
MDSFRMYAVAAVQDREAFSEVREEVHREIQAGGKRFSERQLQLTDHQQRDFVPTFAGLAGGCSSIAAFRRIGFFSKYPRIMILIPAIPFYIFPYQAFYYTREAQYLVQMMREDKSSKFAKRLRSKFEDVASSDSSILEELQAGSEIEDIA